MDLIKVQIGILLLLVISVIELKSQSLQYLQHAAQIGSADNSPILIGASALYANPAAAIHEADPWEWDISAYNRYGTDIRGISGAVNHHLSNAAIGFMIGQYGIEGFSRSQVSIHYSRAIGAKAYLGVQGHYRQLRIEGLGQTASADMTIGFWQQITDRWIISSYILNPIDGLRATQRTFGKADIGSALIISEPLTIFSSLSRSWDGIWSLRPGMRYRPMDILSLYIAISTSPSSMSFGADIELQNGFDMHLGLNTHHILGRSLALSISYAIN